MLGRLMLGIERFCASTSRGCPMFAAVLLALALALALARPTRVACAASPARVSGTAELGRATLRYSTDGQGPVTVVFENDIPGDQRTWSAIAPQVARFARVITYDRAGHGWSPAGHAPRDPRSVAQELELLLQKLEVRPPLVIVALGHGGVYAREFASERPDAVRRLILIDSPHPDFVARRAALVGARDAKLLRIRGERPNSALAPVDREELAAIDASADARAWASLDSLPTVVVSAGRHQWPAGTAADAQELLWMRTQREMAQRNRASSWVLMDVSGPEGILTQADSLVQVIHSALPETAASRGSWWERIVEWLLLLISVNPATPVPVSVRVVQILVSIGGLLWAGFNPKLRERFLNPLFDRLTKHKTHRDWTSIYDIIGRTSVRRGAAVRLLESYNQRALEEYREKVLATSSAPQGARKSPPNWKFKFLEQDWRALRNYVEPTCRLALGETDALAWLKSALTPSGSPGLGGGAANVVKLRGASGAGKSTLLHRLYFDLVAGEPKGQGQPTKLIPMLVQPGAVIESNHLDRLQAAKDDKLLRILVEVWLANRHVDVPDSELEPLVEDFMTSLSNGEIVILLDGMHRLHALGLDGKLEGAIHRARVGSWVTVDRGHLLRAGQNECLLLEHWTRLQVETYVRKRGLNGRLGVDAAQRALMILDTETDDTHWLRSPRNLDTFLENIERHQGPVTDELLKSWCRGEAEFLRACFQTTVRESLAADAVEGRIEVWLFNAAAAQIGGVGVEIAPLGADATADAVRALTDVVQVLSTESHEVVRIRDNYLDLFHAGYLARQLEAHRDDLAYALGANRWTRRLTRFVLYWVGHDSSRTRELEAVIRRFSEWKPADASPPAIDDTRLRNARANAFRFMAARRMSELRTAQPNADDAELRRQSTWTQLDLSGAELSDADLHLMRFDSCSFESATLEYADLSHSRFHDCSFPGARLTSADATGAVFGGCRFKSASGEKLQVLGFQIDGAEFNPPKDGTKLDASREDFKEAGADVARSRYRGEFGERFLNAQHYFLGKGLERLEGKHYRSFIRQALAPAVPGAPVYLVDLMAGGSGKRILEILEGFEGVVPQVCVLAVDRDRIPPPALSAGSTVKFCPVQLDVGLGTDADSGGIGLGLDLRRLVGVNFETPGGSMQPDVIIAKKAIHELPREHQRTLLRECREALRPGGRLVLFADTPGGRREGMREGDRNWLESVRRQLLDPSLDLEKLRTLVLKRVIPSDLSGKALFGNLWIMLKDWANGNTHELANRYFASVGELQEWGVEAGFRIGDIKGNRYDLTVALFNEEGIRNALHHVVRNGKGRCDVAQLREWLVDVRNPRFHVFREFAEHHLAPGSALAKSLKASDTEVQFEMFDPEFRNIRVKSRTFKFPVHVMTFIVPPEQEASRD